MTQINLSSEESQHKIIEFLNEEFSKLKLDHDTGFKKRMFRRNPIPKKLEKLYFKVDSILKVNHLNPAILDELRLLQQEIAEYIQKQEILL